MAHATRSRALPHPLPVRDYCRTCYARVASAAASGSVQTAFLESDPDGAGRDGVRWTQPSIRKSNNEVCPKLAIFRGVNIPSPTCTLELYLPEKHTLIETRHVAPTLGGVGDGQPC